MKSAVRWNKPGSHLRNKYKYKHKKFKYAKEKTKEHVHEVCGEMEQAWFTLVK